MDDSRDFTPHEGVTLEALRRLQEDMWPFFVLVHYSVFGGDLVSQDLLDMKQQVLDELETRMTHLSLAIYYYYGRDQERGLEEMDVFVAFVKTRLGIEELKLPIESITREGIQKILDSEQWCWSKQKHKNICLNILESRKNYLIT